MESPASPYSTACPKCGAAIGELCINSGKPVAWSHDVRQAQCVANEGIFAIGRREIDTSLLTTAAEVIADRQAKYGSPLEDMRRIAQMWSGILGIPVKPEQVPLCMEAVKISRAVNAYQPDNAVDGCGYWQVYESCMREQFAEGDQATALKEIQEQP